MKIRLPHLVIASGLFLASRVVQAELPTLQEPWLGHFIGMKDGKFQFGVTTRGDGVLHPLKRNGDPVSIHNPIKVNFEVHETKPDGKVVSKKIQWDSLSSEQEAAVDPKDPLTFTGKTTGDATFEVTVVPGPEAVSLTGRILDKGTLTNPLTFAITTDFKPYKRVGDNREAFEKKSDAMKSACN